MYRKRVSSRQIFTWREKIEDKKKGLLIKEERAGNKAGISFYLFFFYLLPTQ